MTHCIRFQIVQKATEISNPQASELEDILLTVVSIYAYDSSRDERLICDRSTPGHRDIITLLEYPNIMRTSV